MLWISAVSRGKNYVANRPEMAQSWRGSESDIGKIPGENEANEAVIATKTRKENNIFSQL